MKSKRTFGQHFLTSRAIVRTIVRTANLREDDTVLEIGPGKGILTEALLASAGRVIAVEKDPALVSYLTEKFAQEIGSGTLMLVSDDIRTFRSYTSYKLQTINYKLVANIPYYITGEILRHFLSTDNQPTHMVLLTQKEVAERIARSEKESVLSISVKAYGTPHYVKAVPARYFSPRPKVDSAILSIEDISRDFFVNDEHADGRSSALSEQRFFTLVKAGFAHKRKLLARNVERLFQKETPPKIFEACGISEKARAEDVSLDQWKCLSRAMSPSS